MNRAALTAAIALALLAACDRGESEAELIAAAKRHLDKRETSAAVIQIKNALAKNPDSTAARVLLGKTLLHSGDSAAALIELRKARSSGAPDEQVVPELARAMLMTSDQGELIARFGDTTLNDPGAQADLKTTLAAAYASLNRPEEARNAAQLALKAKPGHAPAVIALARVALQGGDSAAALRQLDELLAREPTHEAAGLLQGEIHLHARQDANTAIAIFRKVRSAHPQSVAASTTLINALVQRDQLPEARSEFEQLRKLAPDHPDTLYLAAQFAFADGNYQASYEILERMLARVPNDLRLLTLAGTAQFKLNNYTMAESLYVRALRGVPGHALTRRLLAQTYLRASLPQKTIDVLQPLVESADADAASLAMTGDAYLRLGDHKRAESAFQRALKAAPDDTRVRTSLATAQLAGGGALAESQLEAIARSDRGINADLALVNEKLRRNDVKGALQAAERLQKKQPDQAFPDALRGRLLAQGGDAAGAAAAFEKALAKDPKHLPAANGLVALDIEAGRFDQARKRITEQIKADDKNVTARLALVDLDTRTGAPEAAVLARIAEAVKADPSNARARVTLIERLLAGGDAREALIAAQDASAALPNDLAVLDALGRAQIAAGDGERAVTTFQRLAAALPRSHRPHLRLADAHAANRNMDAAAAALRQALKLQPDDLMAQRGLALIAAGRKNLPEGIAIARSIQQRLPKDAFGHALEGELEAGAQHWAAAAAAYREAFQRAKSTDLAIKLHANLAAAGKTADADRMAADWLKGNAKDANFLYHLGDVALAAKDLPRAEAHYRAVVALQPRHAAAMNNIAWLLATQRKPGAVAMAEQANTLMPDRAPLLDTLSLALEVENQLPKAVGMQRRAVELDPKDPMLRLRLVQLLVKQGDKAGARQQIQPLMRLGHRFPAHAEVTALLNSL